jgi:hypothetical protein
MASLWLVVRLSLRSPCPCRMCLFPLPFNSQAAVSGTARALPLQSLKKAIF